MKNKMLLGVVFLLTGCPGPGDRMVDRESTTALIKDNQVCVLSPLEPQERITAIQIKSDNSDSLHKIFDDKPVYVPKGSVFLYLDLSLRLGSGIASRMTSNLISQNHI
jgi:hypothetical protein